MRIQFDDGTTETYDDTELSSGAEGDIYLSADRKHVVKLYNAQYKLSPAEIQPRIKLLIGEMNPTKDANWAEYFTWPDKLVVAPRVGYRMRFAGGMKKLAFYIMPKSFAKLPPAEKGWYIGRVAVAIKLASAANRMASMGLCYPDFSLNNVMVEPFDGRMALIDCDSLTVPKRLPPTVEGTTWYRAPELVTGKASVPTVETDRHALAVVLYQWLLDANHKDFHPLYGKKVFDRDPDRDDLMRYGLTPMYSETNEANRDLQQRITSRALGPEMEELFRRTFTEGLKNPNKRPFPFEWQQALYHMYDRLIPCSSPHCTWRFFVAKPAARLTCPMCEQPLKFPRTLPFIYLLKHKGTGNPDDFNIDVTRAHYVVGWQDKPLQRWHTTPNATPIYTDPAHMPDTSPQAAFEFDPRSEQWYLKNLALPRMRYVAANDSSKRPRDWPIGRQEQLTSGMLIHFGDGPEYFRGRVQVAKVD